MSFINSVLAGITGSGGAEPLSARQQALEKTVTSSGELPRSHNSSSGQEKRKARDDLQSNRPKVIKQAPGQESGAKHTAFNQSSPDAAALLSRQAGASPTQSRATAAVAAPPKKGSFAEILARGKAAQASGSQVGAIKHKAVEKLSRKERRALRDPSNSKRSSARSPPADANVVSRSRGSSSTLSNHEDEGSTRLTKGSSSSKTISEPTGQPSKYQGNSQRNTKGSGYQGTARAAKPISDYKGTAHLRHGSMGPLGQGKSRSNGTSAVSQAPRYRYTADSEDDEEEGDGYESEGSSDMEAAAMDLEEEEQLSLRTAKKEDEEALREEMDMKRKKEEKRRKLQAMAARNR
ncbi:MAG: hypothetical protein M1833_004825 [Piccolia ochrophora]|nr:MAG: hypothetical protein M1833_004825 [Piccolia ochrophora]